MLMPILIVLLWLLVICAAAYGAYYIIGQMKLPTPQIQMILCIIVGIVLLVILLGLLISTVPGSSALLGH